jgi:hypothetical protein
LLLGVKPEPVALSETRLPPVPPKVSRASWPGTVFEMETAGPPGEIEPVASAGTS